MKKLVLWELQNYPHLGTDRCHHSAPNECSSEASDQVRVEECEGGPGELTTGVQVTIEETSSREQLPTQTRGQTMLVPEVITSLTEITRAGVTNQQTQSSW